MTSSGYLQARTSGRKPGRLITFGVAIVLGAFAPASLLPQPSASATAPKLVTSVADVINLATYQVRTTFARPGGGESVRTTTGVLLVPTLVDVHGSGGGSGGLLGGLNAALPDLTVTVFPSLTDVHLVINALPLRPVQPVQVEVIFDLPGGRGVSFGYDQRTSLAPRGLDTTLAFSIFDPPKGEFDFTVRPTGAPSSLTLIGELFTRGAGTTRVDPKGGRLTVTPVPTRIDFGLAISAETPRLATGDPLAPLARKTITVDVATPTPTVAHAVATDVTGPDRLEVDATITQLPAATTVTYVDETVEASPTRTETLRRIAYAAGAPIGRIDTLVTQSVAGVVTRTIDADITDLPSSFTADLRQAADLDAGVAVLKRTNVDWLGGAPVGAVDVVASDLAADGALTRQVLANVDEVPTELHVMHETSGVDDPATGPDERRTVVDVQAPVDPIGSIDLGLAEGGAVVLPDARALFAPGELEVGAVPGYVVADGDDAALGLTDLTSARFDTADPTLELEPLVVDVAAGASPFVVRQLTYDDASNALARDVVARVLDLTSHTVVTYAEPPVAAGAPLFRRIGYEGSDAIEQVVASIKTELNTATPTVIAATVTGIPERFGVDLTTDEIVADGRNVATTDVGYEAPAAVDAIDLTVDGFAPDGQPTRAEAHLTDLPTAFELSAELRDESAPDAGDASALVDFLVTGGEPLGSIRAGTSTGSNVVTFLDPLPFFDDDDLVAGDVPAYAFLHEGGAAVELRDVRAAIVDTANPIFVHVEADPQKMLVHQLAGTRRVEATIFELPSVIDLTLFKSEGGGLSAEYAGSGEIGRIEAFVTDSGPPLVPGGDGVSDIESIDLLIDGIPASLVVTSAGDAAVAPPAACADSGFQLDPLICDGLLGDGTVAGLPAGCGQGGLANPSLCDLLGRPGGVVVTSGDGGGRIDEVKALLTSDERDDPVADDAIGSQVQFDTAKLVDVLGLQEDGVLLDITTSGRQTMYARVRDLTLVQIDAGSQDVDIAGPLDSDSFDQSGEPQKRLTAVQTVPAVDRLSRVNVRVERDQQAEARSLAVRTEVGLTADESDYLDMSLLDAPDDVAFTSGAHTKREVDRIGFDDPCTGALTGPPTRSLYCENAIEIAYEADRTSGTFSVNTNAGDRENLFVSVPSLPEELDFCVATDGECTGYAKGVPVTGLSVRFAASARVEGVDVVDCMENSLIAEVLGRGCGRDGAGVFAEVVDGVVTPEAHQFVVAEDLGLRFLEIEMNVPPLPEEPIGHLFLNTTGRRLSDPAGTHKVDGNIRSKTISETPECGAKETNAEFDLHGVRANQRYATVRLGNGGGENVPCIVAAFGIIIENRDAEQGQGTMTEEERGDYDVNAGGIAGELRTELLRDE